jgi:hypothetical protein
MRLTDEQIGAELHALRQTPDESFAAALDRRTAAGFPVARDAKQNRELTWGRLLPVFGALAAVAVAAVVIANTGDRSGTFSGGGGRTAQEATPSAPTAVAPKSAGGTSDAQIQKEIQSQATAAGSQATSAFGARPRNGHSQVQERSASLGLSTDADKLQDAADGVVQVTDRYDGFVDSSTVHVGGSRGHASFALRIPTAHLNDAMTDLSDLGHVTALDQGTTNVTSAYTDAGKAYREARAKVDSLLEDLNNAPTASEAASIHQQLDVARDQLAAARVALRELKQRVGLTPVSVQITAQGDGNWSIGDAADDAVGVLEAIGGAALIALAVLVPLAALLALGWPGARELSRRRREAPLDR